MYKYYFVGIIVLIFIITVVVYLVTKEEELNFVQQKTENFQNVIGYEGSYQGNKITSDPDLNTVVYKEKEMKNINNNIYASVMKLNLKRNIFYYMDKPIMKPQQLKKDHKIPKIIWQTTKELPTSENPLWETVNTFKTQNGWEHRFIFDEEAKSFLKENFEPDVLHAFNCLIPGAFKADLLRACLLYIHGGVYADAKLSLHYNLDSFLDKDLILVKEFKTAYGVWNGFMASVPKHDYFRHVIDAIVDNVRVKHYGRDCLESTGPILYGKILENNFPKENQNLLLLSCRYFRGHNKNYINLYDNQEMFITWNHSRKSYSKLFKSLDYTALWRRKKMYDDDYHSKNFKPKGGTVFDFDNSEELNVIWSKGLKKKTDYMLHKTERKGSQFDIFKDVVWVRMGSNIDSDIKAFVGNFKNIKTPKILVTSDGDLSVPSGLPKRIVNAILGNDKIKLWYTQNYDGTVKHEKLKTYPIGLDLHTPRLGMSDPVERLSKMIEIRRKFSNQKDNLIFCDVHLAKNSNQVEQRRKVKEILSGKQCINFLDKRQSQIKIWENYAKNRFSISTHGNGLDCHRTWEILLLGSIVITNSSSLDPLYENLPVVIVSDWNECSLENMKVWYEKYKHMLTEEYIKRFFSYDYWLNK